MTLSDASPATLRVIAAALAHRERTGMDIRPSQLRRLAMAEPEASYPAALVVVLGMGRDEKGWPVELSNPEATVVVGSNDMCLALQARGRHRVRCQLVGPHCPW